MRATKRRLEVYSFFDHTGIEAHLTKMAAQGWLIKSISNLGWVYHRIEPRKLHFTVSYYPQASEFDPEPSDEQQAFHDFCAHTGWQLACTAAQMQIFYNENEKPVPIDTDPALELETIHKTAKRSYLPSYIVLLALAILMGGLFVSRLFGDPIGLLASPANLFTGFAWTMLLLLCVVDLGGYYRWRSQAIKAAERGEFLEVSGRSWGPRLILWAVILGGVYWLVSLIAVGPDMMRWIGVLVIGYMLVLFVLVNAVKRFLKSRKAPRGFNRTATILASFILSFAMMGTITYITLWASSNGVLADKDEATYEHRGRTWIIHQDELPLVVEDLLDVNYEGYIRERRGSESLFLGQFVMSQHARFDAEQYAEIPELDYTITIIKAPFLYDLCQERLLQEQDETDDDRIPEGYKKVYEEQDASLWGAREAYRLVAQDTGPWDQYLLCYDDRIVEIHFDWEPTLEQMTMVAEQLKGA